MSYEAYLTLLDKSINAQEKRNLFDHLENIFLLQNNISQYYILKIKRFEFEVSENNFINLEDILIKSIRAGLMLNLAKFFELLIDEYNRIGNLNKVKEIIKWRLKNSFQIKRYAGIDKLLNRFEKAILEDEELSRLILINLFQQKNFLTIKKFLTKWEKDSVCIDYEESLSELDGFKELFLPLDLSFYFNAQEIINAGLARDLVLGNCLKEKSLDYFIKAVLLSFNEELIEDLLKFLQKDIELKKKYEEVLNHKTYYLAESKTKIDSGKDLLNYTSFSKIKKVNDSQILRNMGEETRAINFHEMANAVDIDATRMINTKSYEIPKKQFKKIYVEELEFASHIEVEKSFSAEDLVCAHLFMGQYNLALKAIDGALRSSLIDGQLATVINLNYYKILCLIKIGDFSMGMQLINEYLSELDITNHQYSAFTYLKYLIYLESGNEDEAQREKANLAKRDPFFKKISGRLI